MSNPIERLKALDASYYDDECPWILTPFNHHMLRLHKELLALWEADNRLYDLPANSDEFDDCEDAIESALKTLNARAAEVLGEE